MMEERVKEKWRKIEERMGMEMEIKGKMEMERKKKLVGKLIKGEEKEALQ